MEQDDIIDGSDPDENDYELSIIVRNSYSDDLESEFEKELRGIVSYNKNNIKVRKRSSDNRVGFYLDDLLFAEIKLTDDNNISEVSGNPTLVKVALAVASDLPYRKEITRRFSIKEDDPKCLEYWTNYTNERQRIEKILAAYHSIPKLPGWETSNPNNHDPSNFRYIVHTVASEGAKAAGGLRACMADEWGVQLSDNLNFDPVSEPDRFVRRRYISCSVIDQAHYGTWQGAGFILDVPLENILKASHEDMGTLSADVRVRRDSYLPAAQNILEKTRWYNEVLIHGTNPSTGSQIKIVGGIVVVDPIIKQFVDFENAYKIERFCDKEGLPLIYLNEPIG